MEHSKLLDAARKAMANSHSPYSKFKVGAAVLMASGKVYTGCNVESASFGLSLCAERVAIFKAVSEGEKVVSAIALACSQPERCTPCGACLNLIREFGPNAEIITETPNGKPRVRRASELLPEVFSL